MIINSIETNEFNYITQTDHINKMWNKLIIETKSIMLSEPFTKEYYEHNILNHSTYISALINLIATKLSSEQINKNDWEKLFNSIEQDKLIELGYLSCTDLEAVKERDPVFTFYSNVFLGFKGWLSIQLQRFAHCIYMSGKKNTALIIQSICSEKFGVDIHPAVSIGSGFMIDHATGVVIGETSTIGSNCTIYHNVTLGGTSSINQARHPKIGSNVMIGCGTILLGNISIGSNTKIGSGSIVLESIGPNSVVVGNKSKIIKQLN